ncbi:MAG: hypothetical protein K6G78_04910 [bacterium]|nr:hypothetical protein [bacterium]
MYSARAAVVCAECGFDLPIGQNKCPNCGSTRFKGVERPSIPPTPRETNIKINRARH